MYRVHLSLSAAEHGSASDGSACAQICASSLYIASEDQALLAIKGKAVKFVPRTAVLRVPLSFDVEGIAFRDRS